jgi:hypothetical protein
MNRRGGGRGNDDGSADGDDVCRTAGGDRTPLRDR